MVKKKSPPKYTGHALNKDQIRRVKLWIKELRSGKHKQAVGRLRTKDGYCCLGVACAYVTKDLGVHTRKGNNGVLRYATFKKLGLHGAKGPFLGNKKKRLSSTLVRLNDIEGRSFERIADFIEDNLKSNKNELFIKEPYSY